MNSYQSLQQLEEDLEYARNNPLDEAFFGSMVERYKNSTTDQFMNSFVHFITLLIEVAYYTYEFCRSFYKPVCQKLL